MMIKQTPEHPLDREIALRYVKFLLDGNLADTPHARAQFATEAEVHPKLLYFNPHIKQVASLFTERSNIERLENMTLKEWLLYHHHYVHQGYRYGNPDLQQKWLGHDILKTPMDCWVYQEILHRVKPDVVLELGVMFGGASHYFASILDLLGHGTVLGVDLTLSKVKTVENKRIEYIEGSSTADDTFRKIEAKLKGKKVVIIADSDHEKNHVLAEARLYARFVPVGSYYVVEDSLNDVMHWHPVPNEGPQAAALAFLAERDDFVADRRWAERYIMTLTPHGYLLRTKPEAGR